MIVLDRSTLIVLIIYCLRNIESQFNYQFYGNSPNQNYMWYPNQNYWQQRPMNFYSNNNLNHHQTAPNQQNYHNRPVTQPDQPTTQHHNRRPVSDVPVQTLTTRRIVQQPTTSTTSTPSTTVAALPFTERIGLSRISERSEKIEDRVIN